ncbi:poly (ADP-ribose) polymerase 2 [Citrus sinensis]|uniref:Poly (ADP-ribose) polymerase 2 n=2 Tax=Citrus sinensis TaxID=2711 RepID=A0ACB8MKP4_CITSI|nr:poly (ADP-ribose) polymerase 2 [Citrus sinensis]
MASNLKVDQLRAKLAQCGLSTAGTDATLVQRLEEAVEEENKKSGNDIYDARLNQTNIEDNSNDFYVIQLLESDGGGECMVYDRWGRVGVKGQDTIFGPYNLQDTAINEFEQKLPRPRTTGPTGYNANKLPLGTLSKSTILKGYDVLKRIADVIHLPDRRKLEQLSGEFYTVIPHDFGFQKMGDLVIDTPQKLKLKLEMVKALGEIEVATNLLEDDTQIQIAKYLLNTHAKTHSSYSVDIVQIFRVEREGETERFKKLSNSKNRMLLWHGSRLTNWTGILSQGLRIAPPEAPATGYMFGKGVYFADMFSNSADYCNASPAATAGVLLLCEVALGDMSELLSANSDADKLPDGKLITKGVGQTAPDPLEAETLEDGVTVPLGKPKEQLSSKGHLLYNEYIVYSVDQIRMRYVVQVNFKYK